MQLNNSEFLVLMDRYLAGTASAQERELIEQTLLRMSGDSDCIDNSLDNEEHIRQLIFQRTISRINNKPAFGMSKRAMAFIYSHRYAAAAALVLIVLSGALWLMNNTVHKPQMSAVPPPAILTNDVAPGKMGAVLTLADGSTIILDSAGSGLPTSEKGAKILKNSDGLVYKSDKDFSTSAYNTLSTPIGRQYQITLSDGTKVWLNAASSITYPASFTGKERKVSISGEVYFEVTENKKMPFLVSVSSGQFVEVLGTHFNINVYDNEPTWRTTLLEGSVRLNNHNSSVVIKPGQQASSRRGLNKFLVSTVDTEEVMAWKEGFFQFDHADLNYLLRQLSRWYDLDIVFEGAPPDRKLGGRINRNLHLSAVLKALQAKDIHFRLEGKKLIIKS